MSIKATVLGLGRAAFAPTRLGTGSAPAPAVPTGEEHSPAPTALPSFLGGLPDGIVEAGKSLAASVLPGVVRRMLDVPLEELAQRFPGISEAVLGQTRRVIAAEVYDTWGAAEWLGYGRDAQEGVSEAVKARLRLLEQNDIRSTARHLSRLHAILAEVLEAFRDTGFLARNPMKAWQQHQAEVKQLETLLQAAAGVLTTLLKGLADLGKRAQQTEDALEAHRLAAEFLSERSSPEVAGLLASRHAAVMTSQALLLEHRVAMRADETMLHALVEQVADGVLIKLPALYTQLAGMPDKPTNTQRFLLAEQVNALIQLIERK